MLKRETACERIEMTQAQGDLFGHGCYQELVCKRCDKTIPHAPNRCQRCGATRTEFTVELPRGWQQALPYLQRFRNA